MSAEHFPETALDGAKAHIQELVQHHADSVYRTVLDSVQDYLIDNAQFNIGQKIATAKRGERDALAKVAALEAEKTDLLAAMEDIEGRVDVAMGLYHDATRWRSEDGYTGEESLWSWVFRDVRAAIAKAGGAS